MPGICRSRSTTGSLAVRRACELAVDVLAALRQGVDLGQKLEQARVQQGGHRARRVGEGIAHRLNRALRPGRNADAELTQATAQEVQARRARRHPL